MSRDVINDNRCFVCGQDNPEGLRIVFHVDPETRTLRARYTPPAKYQGFKDVLHGGIISTLLDEGAAHLVYALGTPCLTAEIKVRFRKPAPIGRELTIIGEIVNENRRVVEAASQVCNEAGETLASAEVKLVKI